MVITLCYVMLISEAGTGKTIIRRVSIQLLASNTDFHSSIVIETLVDLPESTVLYHFCDLAVRKSIVVLQSFLRQTLHKGSRYQVSLLEQCCKHSSTPSLRELSMTLSDTARLNKNTFIVVDALDELEDRKSLIPILRGLTKAGIKVLVTSRDIPDIRDAFQTEKRLEIEAERSDLEIYVGSRLTGSDHYESLNPNAGIVSAIVDPAGGMYDFSLYIYKVPLLTLPHRFLLARLMMDHVLDCISIKQMRSALKTLPSNLADAYESTFKRILEQSPFRAKLATRVIGWITHAEQRLKVEELRHALAFEEDAGNIDRENLTATKIILQVCIGLLYIDPVDDTISLVHLTAYEYFRQLKDHFSHMQLEMAKTCIMYLGYRPVCDGTCSSIEALQGRFMSMPLLGYAAKHWGDHARQVEQDLSSKIFQVLNDEGLRGGSFQALQYQDLRDRKLAAALFESLPTRLEPLHIAAYWNLVLTGEKFLEQGVDPNILDAQEWSPLHWACSRGSEEMMNTLLEYGACIDARDLSGWTPLFWATIKGHVQIVTRLLHKNANHLLVDSNGWTVLHWAASKGKAPIPQILLDHHSKFKARQTRVTIRVKDITVEDAERMSKSETSHKATKTPLEIAAEIQDFSTFDTIIEDLAARGAGKDFNELWEQKGWDAPRVSSTWRIMSKADRFDEKGLRRYNINKISYSSLDWKTNLLHGAIRDGKALIVRLLVELGTELQGPYSQRDERTPLEHASLLEDPEITNILLENGAFDSGASDAGSPLRSAIARGFDRTVEALLQGGIDVDVREEGGKTPLMSACGIHTRSDDHTLRSLPLTIVKMLIHHGADACAIDDRKNNALHCALEEKAPIAQFIKFLLESGVDANAQNSAGFTPFHNFCKGPRSSYVPVDRETEETFDLLLAHLPSGVENIECHHSNFWDEDSIDSPLALALEAKNWPVFHLLLAKGAILRTSRSPDDFLEKSAGYLTFQPKAVELLLALGANAKTGFFDEPVGHVALAGLVRETSMTASRFEDFKSIFDMYVNHGMDVNATDDNRSLLHVAVTKVQEQYESALTQYLLDVGVNPYQPSHGVWDPFLLATIHGRLSALRVLISHAAKNPDPDHWLRLPESPNLTEDSGITEIIYTSLSRAQCLETLDGDDGVGSTPLQKAVELGKTSVAAALVSHPANLQITDKYGWTLLHTATYNRDFPTTKLLLSVGASPMATTSQWAHDHGRPSGLGRGDPWTGTPLHLAAMFGEPAIASLLLAHGADVHASTGQGNRYSSGHGPTALHIALDTRKFYGDRQSLGKGILEVARMLVEHGASVVDVAEHLDLGDVCRFRGFEELWEKLRAGIQSEGKTFECLDGKVEY